MASELGRPAAAYGILTRYRGGGILEQAEGKRDVLEALSALRPRRDPHQAAYSR